MDEKKIKVLMAKPGLDGHDRGILVVTRALREAGMEVVYSGLRQTPEMIVEAVRREQAEVLGLSTLSGAHMTLIPRILELLKENGLEGVKVFLGGIIPDADVPVLEALGVRRIYGPGTLTETIIADLRAACAPRHAD